MASVQQWTHSRMDRAEHWANPAAEAFGQSHNRYYFYRGRTALYALLRALGMQAGDEVVVQAYTCLAVILPIMALGLTPVYVDVKPGTYTIDPAAVEARITPQTRVLIIQHTFGISAELSQLLTIAKRHNLAVIEDCCHVYGSTYDGVPLGSFGAAAFYSFHWSKPVVVGRGGLAVVNEPALAERLAILHASFCEPGISDVVFLNAQYLAYQLLKAGMSLTWLRRILRSWSPMGVASGQFKSAELKYKITDDYKMKMARSLQSRVSKIVERGAANVHRRRAIGNQLHEHAVELGISPLDLPRRDSTVLMCYPLFANERSRVLREGWLRKIEVTPAFISPVDPFDPSQWAKVSYRAGSCPVAEKMSEKTITLPIREWATDRYVAKVLSFLDDMKDRGLVESLTI
jgi:perosamine synthetase